MYLVLHVLSKRFNITPVVCDLATGTGSFRSEMECIEQYDVCVCLYVCMYVCVTKPLLPPSAVVNGRVRRVMSK